MISLHFFISLFFWTFFSEYVYTLVLFLSNDYKHNPALILIQTLICKQMSQGSLTTPSCSESVNWAIIPVKIGISETQLEVFREASTYAGNKLSDNFRPTQELNGRIVKRASKNNVTHMQSELTIILFFSFFYMCDSLC